MERTGRNHGIGPSILTDVGLPPPAGGSRNHLIMAERIVNRTLLLPGAWFLVFTAGASGQAKISLTKPDVEFAEPFTNISSIRELPSGKVLISDMQERLVQLLDFATGKITKVGGVGKGPGEYSMPGELLPLPTGETLLNDFGGQRFLTIGPDGKPGKTVRHPDLTGGGGGGMMFFGGPGGMKADAAGNIYMQMPPFPMGALSPGKKPKKMESDSVTAIVRWTRATGKIDTVAWIAGPKIKIEAEPVPVPTKGGGAGGFASAAVMAPKVFAPEEAWGVAGDGSVIRVQPSPYRVLRYGPAKGKPMVGPTQPYTPIKVTEQDKTDFKKAMSQDRGISISISSDGVSETRGAPPPETLEMPGLEFEDTKPPFGGGMLLRGGSPLLVTPEGEAWVSRLRPAGDSIPRYDVFDLSGKLVKTVTLKPRSTIIGFGKGTLYVIRMDEDDLQYLQRYKR